ncbi:hypothetical protein [Pseudomonas poae]|uniref:Uncharacterized protein n=1 Tax=Pseudomonas poae TaxID=200451 RepID=A0ABY0S915_9PSED|nr:hypothetical protein [Pseudomonas poae]SDO93402.1 hypothetical protein SAMN04490208_5467 [Pseudomonas poae]
MPFVGFNQLDWTDPAVAMTLVTNLSQGNPFTGGVIKCSDAFLVGRVLGDLLGAAFNTAPDKEVAAKFEPLVEWAQLEALRFAIEMKQMYDITEEIITPMPVLSRDPAKRVQAMVELAQWISTDLISNRHTFHQACFDLGYRHAWLFNLLAAQHADQADPNEYEAAASIARNIVKALLSRAEYSQEQMFQSFGFVDFMAFLDPYFDDGINLSDAQEMNEVIEAIPTDELLARFPISVVKGADSISP